MARALSGASAEMEARNDVPNSGLTRKTNGAAETTAETSCFPNLPDDIRQN